MSYHGYFNGFGQAGVPVAGHGYDEQYAIDRIGPLGEPIIGGPVWQGANLSYRPISLGKWFPLMPPSGVLPSLSASATKVSTSPAGLLQPMASVPNKDTYAGGYAATADYIARMEGPRINDVLNQTGPQTELLAFNRGLTHWLRTGAEVGVTGLRSHVFLPIADLVSRYKAGKNGTLPDLEHDDEFREAVRNVYELAHIADQVARPAGVFYRTVAPYGPMPQGGQAWHPTADQLKNVAWRWKDESNALLPAGYAPAHRTVYVVHADVANRARALKEAIQHATVKYHNELVNASIDPTPDIPPPPPPPGIGRPMLIAGVTIAAVWLLWQRGTFGRLKLGRPRSRSAAPGDLTPKQMKRVLAHPRRGIKEAKWSPLKM